MTMRGSGKARLQHLASWLTLARSLSSVTVSCMTEMRGSGARLRSASASLAMRQWSPLSNQQQLMTGMRTSGDGHYGRARSSAGKAGLIQGSDQRNHLLAGLGRNVGELHPHAGEQQVPFRLFTDPGHSGLRFHPL